MPLELERELRSSARKLARSGKLHKKKGMSLEDAEKAYTYGTLRAIEQKSQRKGNKPGKYLHNV